MKDIERLVYDEVYYCSSHLIQEIGRREIDQWHHLFIEAAGDDEDEIYEHWIVSEWLAFQLEQQGEVVERDFYGLTIWGRTTTGQAIAMDAVIQEIYHAQSL